MKLYDTLSRSIKEIVPINKDKLTIYTCGPTVYDYPHIGNWSGYVKWDVLVRVLRSEFNVEWVMNITDVGHLVSDDDTGEDKLEKGAKRDNKTAWQVAEFYGNYFIESLDRLNINKPDHITKATDHIKEQIALVNALEERGFTYVIEDGVYFDTARLNDYGKLARLKPEDLKAGARVEITPGKKNITDFALWKFSPKNEKRDMEWGSPWGKGFPGWHIECSAMSMKYLGDTLDIHCGGIDHIPVHHTNEIAQSEAATGKLFANVWVHNNFLKVYGQKMSKSLGNLITLEDIETKGYSLQDFRLMVLESHYRKESQFTWEVLEASRNRLNHWLKIADLRWQIVEVDSLKKPDQSGQSLLTEFVEALHNDLNTPLAITKIDEMVSLVESTEHFDELIPAFNKMLRYVQDYLGIDLFTDNINPHAKELLLARQLARDNKDYQKSDELRNKILSMGYEIKDTKSGQQWHKL